LSSILKALKKLDEESLSPDQGVIEPQKKMKQVLHRRAAPPTMQKWLVTFGIVVVLIVVSVVFLALFKDKSPTISGNPGRPDSLTNITKKTETKPKPSNPSPVKESSPKKVLAEQPEAKPVTDKTGPAAQPAVQGNTVQQPLPLSGPGNLNPPQAGNITAGRNKEIKAAKIKKPRPEMTLNGILWSDNVERRVALINNRYMREGDTIDGVTLVKIEKKAVTLQSGDYKWTIPVKR